MITKITAANAARYQSLFKDASIALSLWDTSNDTPVNTPGKPLESSISVLEQYFAHLRRLSEIDRKYVQLPLDEEVFDIDANTRKITVPPSFRSGIAVQGDELAEVVYFRIDRYFDAVDLNNMDIAIQWTNAAGESGVSKEFVRDVVSEEGKIIFGWPISNAIAKAPGTIRFSVRFYDLVNEIDKTQGFNFNFNTLTAIVLVNSSLDFNLAQVTEEDKSDVLMGRVVNSSFLGTIIADKPYFYNVERRVPYTSSDNILPPEVDDTDGAMKVMAISPDGGTLTYSWYYKANEEDPFGVVEKTPIFYNLFVPIATDATYDENLVYYQEKEGTILQGVIENTGDIKTFTTANVNETNFATQKAHLYMRFSAYKVNEGAGYYMAAVENAVYGDKAVTRSNVCSVPGPTPFEILKNMPTQFEIVENRTNEGDTNNTWIGHVEDDYASYYENTLFFVAAKKNKNNDTYTFYRNDTVVRGPGPRYHYEDVEEEGTYTCVINRTRNGSSISITSNECTAVYRPLRIRPAASAGATGYRFREETQNINGDPVFDRTVSLHLDVVTPEESMPERSVPEVTYQWYVVYGEQGQRSAIPGATSNTLNANTAEVVSGTSVNCDIICRKGGFSEFISTTKKITAL